MAEAQTKRPVLISGKRLQREELRALLEACSFKVLFVLNYMNVFTILPVRVSFFSYLNRLWRDNSNILNELPLRQLNFRPENAWNPSPHLQLYEPLLFWQYAVVSHWCAFGTILHSSMSDKRRRKMKKIRDMMTTDRQTYRQTDIPTDRQTDLQTDRQTYRQTDLQTDSPTYRQTDLETDRQTYRQTVRRTEWHTTRKTDIQTYRKTDTQIHSHSDIQTARQTERHTYTDKQRDRRGTHRRTGFMPLRWILPIISLGRANKFPINVYPHNTKRQFEQRDIIIPSIYFPSLCSLAVEPSGGNTIGMSLLTCAQYTITCPPRQTVTCKVSDCVGACCVLTTVINTACTLINLCDHIEIQNGENNRGIVCSILV